MDAEGTTDNSILYILLITSSIFIIVDTLEFIQIIKYWGRINAVPLNTFESCVKWEFYTKTVFCVYSLLGAVSAFILILMLFSNTNFFLEKYTKTFRYFNYILFGPYMLGFSIMGIYNWRNVLFVCDKKNNEDKFLSFTNLISLIAVFLLSILITLLVLIIKTITIYLNSILNRPGGSPLLRKLFWKFIFRNREPVQFVRSVQRSPEEQKENN